MYLKKHSVFYSESLNLQHLMFTDVAGLTLGIFLYMQVYVYICVCVHLTLTHICTIYILL